MPRARNMHGGFTLVEVIVALAVMLIVLGSIVQLFVSHMYARDATQNYMVASEHNQRALQKMAEELRGANSSFLNVVFTGSQGQATLPSLVPGGANETVTLYSAVTFRKITGMDTANWSQTWSSDITLRLNSTTNQVERVQDGNVEMLAGYATRLSFYNAPGKIGIILGNTCGQLGPPRNTGARVENRIEVYPLNSGTN